MITYDKEYENIILVLDTKCPYAQKMGVPEKLDVETRLIASLPHNFVMPFQPDTIKIATIKNLGGYKALALEHRPLFEKYLKNTEYSARAFVNIYIWSDLFNILWKIVDNNLCVFYKYKNEFNTLLPPICHSEPRRGEESKREILRSLRSLRMTINRIENITENELKIFKDADLKIHKNTDEYIYLTKNIAELKGNRYGSQRAALNHFVKNNKFIYRPFTIDDIDECLELYAGWAKQKKNKDNVYQQLIADSFSAQRKAMLNYEELSLTGAVVEIDDEIRAYTFAFKMNPDTYCIVFETADTDIKGLPQFIFSRFAQDLAKDAKYLNAMDDSGLASLRKTKLSWHPHKILTNYIGVI